MDITVTHAGMSLELKGAPDVADPEAAKITETMEMLLGVIAGDEVIPEEEG